MNKREMHLNSSIEKKREIYDWAKDCPGYCENGEKLESWKENKHSLWHGSLSCVSQTYL